MLKMSEIKKMDASAIAQKSAELRKEIFDIKLQKATSSIEKPHVLKNLRKDIARLQTALNTKESK